MNHLYSDRKLVNLLSAIILLVVVVYFCLQIWNYFTHPFTTITIYQYEDDESVPLSGILVRQETLLPHQDSGVLQLTRQEGDRVSVGGTVARVYSDAESALESQELTLASNLVEQLTFAQSASQSAEASVHLDEDIADALLDYQQALAAGRLEDLDDLAQSLRSLVRQRDFSYDSATITEDLEAATAQYDALASQNRTASTTVRASVSGLYSAVVDGYEYQLTPDTVSSLTPSSLAALQTDTSVYSNVGKLILGDTWYYVATVDEDVALQALEAGNVGLRFSKGLSQTLEMDVTSISAVEDGQCVLVLESREYLGELTLLRNQSATLVFETISGLRVPLAALRLNDEGVTGIYCVVGVRATFKPVTILYQGSDFMLVESASSQASLQLRSGDLAIIAADELYNGMVVD